MIMMNKNQLPLAFQRFWPVLVILLLWFLHPRSWKDKDMDWSSDLLFTLRSDRAGDDRILLVYVGTQDLEALGGH